MNHKSDKKPNKKRTFSLLRLLRNLFGLMFIISLVAVGVHIYDYYKMRSYNEEIIQKVLIRDADSTTEDIRNNQTDSQEEASETEEDTGLPVVNFQALYEINGNSVGWLYACEGDINYPVVASDNNYYLTHAIDGTASRSGTIFVDSSSRNPFEEARAVIYGHNMKDGTMFKPLLRYWQDKNYLSENPYIYIITEEKIYTYQITSVFVAEYENVTSHMQTVSEDSKLIDLITCEYSGKETRLVVEAELIETENNE